jgi:hypothetical protein
MVEYQITTSAGKFVCKIMASFDRNTKQPETFNINIGSKERFCVQLKVPSRESGQTEAYLMWVEAHEECSLEKYIEKGLAKQMTLLGLTITRKINPNIKTVSFEDTSSFNCDLPNKIKKQVPMKAFHIAFHEATWYELNFDAQLKHDYERYCKLKKNMYKSENKPKRFDFINEDLQKELEPLYESTTNWYDFFKAIENKYGNKKCGVVYPWLTKAMYEIFKCNIYEDTHWYIDFKENEERNKTPIIDFNLEDMAEIGNKTIGGKTIGSKIRNKTNKKRRFTYSRTHIFPNIREIQKWNYLNFF